MPELAVRMTAAEYLETLKQGAGPARARKAKFGNRRVVTGAGLTFDSAKELRHFEMLEASRRAMDPAQRVDQVVRQARYLLVPKQEGERAVHYVADFVVTYGDGRVEVQDTKSPPTRRERTYVLKRKLMLAVHGIRIVEL